MPFSCLSLSITSTDGGFHSVQLYTDVSSYLAIRDSVSKWAASGIRAIVTRPVASWKLSQRDLSLAAIVALVSDMYLRAMESL